MAKYGMIIDVSRCTACYCCFMACRDEYWDNDFLPYTAAQPKFGQYWMNILNKERGRYPHVKVACIPVPCMQCQSAPCIKSAENEAVYRRPDGIVVIDPEKSSGQKQLVDSCPYGAIYWNEEKNLAQKCSFCVHRLEEGNLPRCVQACPTNAITFGDLDNPDSNVSTLINAGQTDVFHPEYETDPLVKYLDLKKVTLLFIAGAVVFEDTDECAENVIVTLIDNDGTHKMNTDNYGNFEFEELRVGEYKLTFEYPGYLHKSMDLFIEQEIYIPEIMMNKTV